MLEISQPSGHLCSWKWIFYCIHLTVWLEPRGSASRRMELEGVGHLVFGEMFRALHVLNLFNLTGKTSTWLQRSLSPTPHPGVQVQSRTWLAQKCPSRPWEMHFWGGVCTDVWSDHERWWLQDETGNKRLRRSMGEIYKGPLQEVDSKKKTLTQALELESSMDTRQQGALSATN